MNGYNRRMSASTTTFPPRALRAGGRLLETLLNRTLDLDAATRERVEQLEGRSVALHLKGPDLRLRVDVEGGRLRVGPAREDASLNVAATPGGLLSLALDRDGAAPGSIEIAGDAALARQLERLVSAFEPDFEAAFSARLGDIAGVPLARGLRGAMRGLRQYGRKALEDGAAWVRDEAGLTPTSPAMADFLDGVDSLSEHIDRLEARLQHLGSTP